MSSASTDSTINVQVPVSTLKWWLELAHLNPQDLAPRIQRYVDAAAAPSTERHPQPAPHDPRRDAYQPIDVDASMARTYIPLPGGWEIQTKGTGSSFRICDPKADRLVVPPSPYLHDELEAMARDVNAAWKRLHDESMRSGWTYRAAYIARELLSMIGTEFPEVTPERQDGNSLPHIAWMLTQLSAEPPIMSDTKACRWLGYAQCWLVTNGLTTLEAEKERNLSSAQSRRYAAIATPTYIEQLCTEIEGWRDGPESDLTTEEQSRITDWISRIRSLHISTMQDERIVELMARYVCSKSGVDYDTAGELVQETLKDTQREALNAARVGRIPPELEGATFESLLATLQASPFVPKKEQGA